MDYINASSSLMGIWQILFHPIILFLAIIITTRFIFGKKEFIVYSQKIKEYIKACKSEVDFDKRFGKAASVIEVFVFLSSLYLLSLLISVIILILRINLTLPSQYIINKESILSIWRYYPYIDDFSTLSRLVSYKASELGLLTTSFLSTQGIIISIGFLINSCIILSISSLIVYFLMFLLRIFRKGRLHRLSKIGRAFFAVILSILLLVGHTFFVLPLAPQSNQQNLWDSVEASLLLSGEPVQDEPSNKEIEKVDELHWQNENGLLNISIGVGPFQFWIEIK